MSTRSIAILFLVAGAPAAAAALPASGSVWQRPPRVRQQLPAPVHPPQPGVAPILPMRGFNTWFACDVHLNASFVLGIAAAFNRTGLLARGYSLLALDGGWQGAVEWK